MFSSAWDCQSVTGAAQVSHVRKPSEGTCVSSCERWTWAPHLFHTHSPHHSLADFGPEKQKVPLLKGSLLCDLPVFGACKTRLTETT